MATKNIIKFSQFKKAHLVYASTSEIYGKNPNIPWKENDDRVLGSTKISRWSYSSVKSTCEHLIHGIKKLNPSFKFTIVRFFNASLHRSANFPYLFNKQPLSMTCLQMIRVVMQQQTHLVRGEHKRPLQASRKRCQVTVTTRNNILYNM